MESTFAQRLAQACDDSILIPEYGKGRQVAVANRLKVTQEAVRKWFTGESLPRPAKMRQLAEFLEVEESWLALGIKPEIDRHEKRRSARQVDGAVHVVSGLIMLEGGNVAFPRDADPRVSYVDVYAILRGAQFALHICLGREISEGSYEFFVPREFHDVKCIGVVQLAPGKLHFLNLTTRLIEEHKVRRSGDFTVLISRNTNRYYTGAHTWPRFKTFGELHD